MKEYIKNWRKVDFLLLIGFTLTFFWIHWQNIFLVPALNYDEVRAGNYTHSIAFTPGSWPFHGSNSYTVVLASYWAAPFYKLFGGGILPLRLSGIIAVFLGLLLISLALKNFGKTSAARVFPFLVTFWPALFINHRYGIEANSFHVLCLGGLLWGLSKHQWPVIALSITMGILSHPFFIAPTLGILFLVLKNQSRKKLSPSDRNWILGLLIFFLFYFVQIFFFIPEKFKAVGLIFLDLGIIFFVIQQWPSPSFFSSLPKPLTIALKLFFYLIASIATVFVLTYSSSFWSLHSATGIHEGFALNGLQILLLGLVLGSGISLFLSPVRSPRFHDLILLFLVTNSVCLVILIQPSARCFELSLVLLAVLTAWVVGELKPKVQFLWILGWILLGAFQWNHHYLKPVLEGRTERKLFKFLFVKGVTETYPSAQNTLVQIASQNCSTQEIRSSDLDLWKEGMVFLNQGSAKSVFPKVLQIPLDRTDCRL